MFLGFLEAHKQFWSMEKKQPKDYDHQPADPPGGRGGLTAVKDSMVFFKGFPIIIIIIILDCSSLQLFFLYYKEILPELKKNLLQILHLFFLHLLKANEEKINVKSKEDFFFVQAMSLCSTEKKWSELQCSAMQCSAVKCSAVQYSAVQCSVVQCSVVQCSVVHSLEVQCSIV